MKYPITKLFTILKRYRLSDYIYFITPPIVSKLIKKLLSNKRSIQPNHINLNTFENELDSLEENGFNYFMPNDVIKDFCNKTRDQLVNSMPSKLDGKDKENLDQLNDNGYVVLENILDRRSLIEYKSKLDPVLDSEIHALSDYRNNSKTLLTSEAPTRNFNGLRSVHNISDAVIRIWNVDSYLPKLKESIDKSSIFKICNAYLSGNAGPSNIYLDIKPIPNAFDSSVTPHADSPFKICKVFIALEDVTVDNAPFLYFKGSHKPNHFRLLKDLLAFSGHNKKFYDEFSSFNFMGMLKLSEDSYKSFSPDIVTLKAGDAIIADTRGIHAATNLNKGRRVQFGLVYSDRDFDINERDPLILGMAKDSI
tara:strand:- start:5276 stop:6370 length:1095 start_codon:yes stop_codon:yes gene_type:complete